MNEYKILSGTLAEVEQEMNELAAKDWVVGSFNPLPLPSGSVVYSVLMFGTKY